MPLTKAVAGLLALQFSLLASCHSEARALSAPAAPARGERLIFHIDERPRARLMDVTHKGRLQRDGTSFKIRVQRRGDAYQVTAEFDEDRPLNFSLSATRYPDLDLATLRTFGYRDQAGVHLSMKMRFGEEVDCFVNDDGKGHLSITFEPGSRVSIVATSYEGCEPHQTEYYADYTAG